MAIGALGAPSSLTGQERDRAKIADKYKWNLADIYPNDAAWRAAKDKLAAGAAAASAIQGQAGDLAGHAGRRARQMSALDKELSRLYVYASMLADQDTRDSSTQGMQQEMVQLVCGVRRGGLVHRAGDPPIAGRAPSSKFLAAEPRLKIYGSTSRTSRAARAHTLTDAEEKLLADVGPLAGTARRTSTASSPNADFPYPTVTLSDGEAVKLDQAAFADAARAAEPRRPRKGDVGVLQDARRLQPDLRHDDERRSAEGGVPVEGAEVSIRARDARSTAPNIPTSVYTRLIDGVNRNLPSFHRYLKLRKRMMGLDELHYYDLYAPLVGSVDLEYTPEEAQKHVAGRRGAARRGLPGRHQARVRRALDRSASRTKASARAPIRTAARTTSTRTC